MPKSLYCFTKRLFDIFSSLLALIVSSPLWLVIAIGIKISSPGPILFRTKRVGKDCNVFTLNKFRSMHVYYPEDLNSDKKSEGGFIANENRIFPFGGFLRKSKLDELPQLINILMGQMSVVGPRPITKAGVEKHYVGEYANVMTVRPGLACLDSLYDYAHGELFIKDDDKFAREIAPVRDCLASMYVQRRNIGLDIYCIWRTLQLIFQIAVQKKKTFALTKYEAEAEKKVFSTVI